MCRLCKCGCQQTSVDGELTVEGGRRASGAAELLPVQHRHAGLACSPAGVIGWGYSSIHTTAATATASASASASSSAAASPRHALFGLQGLAPLLVQPLLVPEEAHQLACFFPHVGPLVSAVAVHVLKITQRLRRKMRGDAVTSPKLSSTFPFHGRNRKLCFLKDSL